MNLFITGGTGFFGRALLRHLIVDSMGYEKVIVLTRNPEAFVSRYPEICSSPLLTFVKGDVTDTYSSWKCIGNSIPDHIIHAATESGISHDLNPIHLSRQIVRGTENVLDYAAKTGASRFLYVSSGAVYGAVPAGTLIPETLDSAPDTSNPRSLYGNAKRLAENLCLVEAQQLGFECMIARCFSFIGRDMPDSDNFALGSFLNAVRVRKDIVIQGDGKSVRSYLNQRDLAFALLAIIQRGGSGETYNVGSDKGYSILEIAQFIRETSTYPLNLICRNKPNTGFAQNWYVPDISKIKHELEFEIKTEFDMSLRELLI
jgi:dTDP-glucose 4,6-dehydratase